MTDIDIRKQRPAIGEATHITSETFGIDMQNVLREEVAEKLESADLMYSFFDHSVLKGFATFRILDQTILYMTGLIVHPSLQRNGVATRAISLAKEETKCTSIVFRTQSIHLWHLMKKMCDELYPGPTQLLPSKIQHIAERIEAEVGTYPVAKGYYGTQKFFQKPILQGHPDQSWWDLLCHFERGDAVIGIGFISPSQK